MQHGTEPQLNAPTPALITAPAADELLAMILALAAEVAAAGDEIESLRSALLRRELLDEATLAEVFADPQVQAARARRKSALVDALMLPLKLRTGTTGPGASAAAGAGVSATRPVEAVPVGAR